METGENSIRREGEGPTVVMRNEPKLSEHEVDQKFNEMRLEFISYIKQFVSEHQLFKNESEIGIEFAQAGISSIIAIIETSAGKFVLKIPRDKKFSAGLKLFSSVWSDAGVRVPNIIETGELHGSPYALMEYINAPILADVLHEGRYAEDDPYTEMGQTLRRMHSKKVIGYGFVVDGKPEFSTVEEWLGGEDMKRRFEYIENHNLLDGIETLLEKALTTIKRHSEEMGSTYCHTDYGPKNIFATRPITVFDPNPKFNNNYYDLGLIRLSDIIQGGSCESSTKLFEGYFAEEECNDRVLHAYTFLVFCIKCPYWHQTKREKELETAKEYFRQHQIY